MTLCDPLAIAWQANGAPMPDDATMPGTCARCRTDATLVPAARVVSRSFTGFDTWADPGGVGLCPCCAWGYRTIELRQTPFLIRSEPVGAVALTRAALTYSLRAPVDPITAITVPRKIARKHVLPTAMWGRVALDDIQLPWTAQDATRLLLYERFRAAGVTPGELTSPAPPWQLIQHLTGPDRVQTLTDWQQLGPWRARPIWLVLAALATQRG